MLDLKESFWSVPEEEWKRLWVRVRWREFSDTREKPTADTDCVNLAELMQQDVDASFGFRSLALYSGARCTGISAVSPFFLDVDLDGDTQAALDNLLARVRDELDSRHWWYRVYRSGVGYHVEVDPISIAPGSWCLDGGYFRKLLADISEAVDGRCAPPDGGKACIDRPHALIRMVGSAHRIGTTKMLIDGP